MALDQQDFSTQLLHADSHGVRSLDPAVGVPISTSTCFRRADPDDPRYEMENDDMDMRDPPLDVYSRYTQPTLTRTEKVLGAACGGYALAYPSGLSATLAALMHYRPSVIAIQGGYFGVHETIRTYSRVRSGQVKVIDLDDEYPQSTEEERFLCWLETPVNPIGVARDISYYAKKAAAVGGKSIVDSTFAPPPLANPLKHGVDCVMHSGSKYFGGHSDVLCGVLVVKTEEEWKMIWHDRTYTGMNLGSLEAWLLLRSLRTLNLRVTRQARTGTELAAWLSQLALNASETSSSFDGAPGGVVLHAWHASLQASVDPHAVIEKHNVNPAPDTPRKGVVFNPMEKQAGDDEPQLKDGPACFSILLAKPEYGKWLPALCKVFTAATSLGGVESLMEQKYKSDNYTDPRIVRLSVGLEDIEDLKNDLRQALNEMLKREKEGRLQ